MKIYRWAHLGLTFAGNAAPIQSFAHAVDAELQRDSAPFDAIHSAYARSQNGDFEAIAALIWEGRPQLFHLTKSGNWIEVKRDRAVHLGSISRQTKLFVQDAIVDVVEDTKLTPGAQLFCVLATCQSLTVHQYLLSEHAGGVFSGLILDREGTRWQPDIGYLLVNPRDMARSRDATQNPANNPYITCIFRHDVLFVNSPLVRHITAMLVTNRPTTTLEMIDQINLGLVPAHEARMNCQLDYVGIISKERPIVAAVEMGEFGHLRMEVHRRADGQDVVSSTMSRSLGDRIRGLGAEDGIPRMIFCAGR